MRKIVVTEFISLDGVIENPAWSFPYWNDEISNFKDVEQVNSDTMLMGRVTYDGFAAAWPNRTSDGADYMNNTRKYVVSTTLDKAEWKNTTVIKANVVEAIKKLKEQEGTDILVYGSGELVQTLLQHNLVDSLRLLVYPVVIGEGKRLFHDGTTAKFTLEEAQAFSSGVTALVYGPAQQ
jgi:dihydrofolate reductase